MNCFENLDTNNLEQVEDSVGTSRRGALESDIYTGVIKDAYVRPSANSQSKGIVLEFNIDGYTYSETIYVVGKEGKPYYVRKDDKGVEKHIPLPGYKKINDLCLIVAGKDLSKVDMEKKFHKVYDFSKGGEVKLEFDTLVDLIGKTISMSIVKRIVNKRAKVGDEYVDTPETKEENEIQHFFHPEKHITVNEAKKDRNAEPAFWNKWLEANKGKTIDKTNKNLAPISTTGSNPLDAPISNIDAVDNLF